MGEWTIELDGPPRFGEEGPYWVGRINVSDGLAESKSLQLKLTQHAASAFARAARVQPIGPELLDRIMAKCAAERVEELLDGGRELPTELSVEGYPGPDGAVVVTHVGAQLMLLRWEIDAHAAVAEPAIPTDMTEPAATDTESADPGEDAGAADVELVVSEPTADVRDPAISDSSEAEAPGSDEGVAAEVALDDSPAEAERATSAQAADAEALLDSVLLEADEAPRAEEGDAAETSLAGATDLESDSDSSEDPTTGSLDAEQDELQAAS